jgi:hypothetical protein
LGPKSRTYFRINTDSTTSGFSVIQNPKLESVGLIEWRSHPIVEIRDILSKRGTSQWLALSPDKTYVTCDCSPTNIELMLNQASDHDRTGKELPVDTE